MKKMKRLLSLILTCVMLASSVVFTVNAVNNAQDPGYEVDFVYDSNTEILTATVSVTGGTYGIGRFGLKYDSELLDIWTSDNDAYAEGIDTIADVVVGENVDGEYDVTATEETNLASELIDTEDGVILFAWYTNPRIVDGKDEGFVVADDGAKEIATIQFKAAEEKGNDVIANINDLLSVVKNVDEPNGWNAIYSVTDKNLNKTAISNKNVKINTIEKTFKNKIVVEWDALEVEEEGGKYIVELYDEDGNLVTTKEIPVGEPTKETFDRDDGIDNELSYVVIISYYSPSDGGDDDEQTIIPFPPKYFGPEKDSQSPVVTPGGSGPSLGGGSSGGSTGLIFTVTYFAGEGTIVEGQKFKYEVPHNGVVAGSPSVIAPEGKMFVGWSIDGKYIVDVTTYKISKDITFKAIYAESDEIHAPFINGYPGGIIMADGTLTRAEAATIIARISGKFDETKQYTIKNFTDVGPEHWAYKYISFVYENNIVNGYENGTFAPDNKITRAEFATIIQRYFGLALHEEETFTDVSKDHWAVAYIGACKAAGIIKGYETGEFRPANEITRAEAVTILNRATGRTPNATAINAYVAENGVPFVDLKADKWYFYEVIEAAFMHLISVYH